MDLNIDTAALKRVAIQVGKANLPFLEQGLQTGATAIASVYGLGFVPGLALPPLFAIVNNALGLDPNTPPDQTAAAIAADPAAAQAALATLDSQQQFALAQQKQSDDTTIAVQAQQTALIAVDQTSESWFARNWRPAAAWICVAGLLNDVLLIPLAQWLAACWSVSVPPAPDATTLIGLLTALLGLGALRQVNNNSKDSVKKAILAPKPPISKPAR